MTTYEEWRVTGQPGEMFNGADWPPYDFTWSLRTNPHLGDPERAARDFMAKVGQYDTWRDGPHLHKRTVTVTDWQEVEA